MRINAGISGGGGGTPERRTLQSRGTVEMEQRKQLRQCGSNFY
jgi:hypothetical protein